MSRLGAIARRRAMLRQAGLQREMARKHAMARRIQRMARARARRDLYRTKVDAYRHARGMQRRDRAYTDFLARHPRPFRWTYFYNWPRYKQKWYYWSWKQRKMPYSYRKYSKYY